jgi:hypothetical protein
MIDYEKIESVFYELLNVEDLGVSDSDITYITELIDAGEYGVSLELFFDICDTNKINVPHEAQIFVGILVNLMNQKVLLIKGCRRLVEKTA